jgi:hypothetical protein
VLRGLTVDGGGTGSNGIAFNSGGKLTIDQCDVLNFVGSGANGNGIVMLPSSGSSHIVSITNTTASNNENVGVYYIPQSGSTATTGVVIDRVTANNNTNFGIGIENRGSTGTVAASISNSIAGGNQTGYYFNNATASLDSSYAAANAFGIFIDASTLALGRSVLMNNRDYGLYISGGSVNSYKDNRIAGNGSTPIVGTTATATLY